MIPKSRLTRAMWAGALGVSAALLALPFLVNLDGTQHADWQQFLGRFHILMVHIPIGLIVLVPVLEIAGKFRPELREAAGFVLWLGLIGCLGALPLGFLLAYGSGDAGAGVTRHMWGGIALTIGLLACLLARPLWTHVSGVAGLRAAGAGVDGAPRRLADAWEQLSDRIHAGAAEALDGVGDGAGQGAG